jgi:hypothetical protein
MMKFVSWLNIIALSVVTVACSTHRAHLKVSEFKEMPISNGPMSGQNLGRISGEDGGAIWNNCTEKARGSVVELIAEAQTKGANAIGDITWHATGNSEPGCKKGWGYLIIWPFILTPLFMSTKVEGTAYKTSGKLKTGMYPVPTTPEEEEQLVDQLVAQLN